MDDDNDDDDDDSDGNNNKTFVNMAEFWLALLTPYRGGVSTVEPMV
jgi:hypothetical protein